MLAIESRLSPWTPFPSHLFLVTLLCLLTPVPEAWAQKSMVFRHTPPIQTVAQKPLLITGVVSNNDELDDAVFCYRTRGTTAYTCQRMKLYMGIRYSFQIPARAIKPPGIEYYVRGVNVNKQPVLLHATPTKPQQIRVISTSSPTYTNPPSRRTPSTPRLSPPTRVTPPLRPLVRRPFAPATRRPGPPIRFTPPRPRGTLTTPRVKPPSATPPDLHHPISRRPTRLTPPSSRTSTPAPSRPTSPAPRPPSTTIPKAATTPKAATNTPKKEDDLPEDLEPVEEDFAKEEGTVYTAAKREQRIQKAPAVIAVLTASDIKAAGWRTLLEALRYVAGVDINDNGHWPDIGIRGVNPRMSYGDKLIVSLDGHNMSWRQFNRNFLNASLVSIDDIKRIEIIRGPGSALWGANAISGVINIITNTSQGLKGLAATIGGSPLSASHFITLRGGQELMQGLVFRGSFSIHRDYRSARMAPIYEFQKRGNIRYIPQGDQSFSQNFQAQLSWRNIVLSFHQSRYDPTAPLSSFSQIGGDDSRFVTDRYFSKLSWATLIGDWGTLFLWTSIDHYSFAQGTAYEQNAFSTDTDPTQSTYRRLVKMAARDLRWEAGGQLSAQIQALSLNVGLDLEYLDLLRWNFPEVLDTYKLDQPTFQNFHFSSFVQAQYNLKNFVEFTLSGRIDVDQQYGFVVTPRAAVVLSPGAGLSAKLLYGNAFKAPSFHDLYYYRKDRFYGNPSLQPESAHTFEVQLGWYRKNLMAVSLSGYFSIFQKLIKYTPTPSGQSLQNSDRFPTSQLPGSNTNFQQKQNSNDLYTYGGSLEFRLFPSKHINVLGNVGVYLGQEGNDSPAALEFTAAFKGSLIASYIVPLGPVDLQLSLGAIVRGNKPIPGRAFRHPTSVLPFVGSDGKPQPVPSWGKDDDPSLETPFYVNSFLMVQVLRIFKKLDIVVRASNVLNLDLYDAGRELLYPQKKFDLNAWLRVQY